MITPFYYCYFNNGMLLRLNLSRFSIKNHAKLVFAMLISRVTTLSYDMVSLLEESGQVLWVFSLTSDNLKLMHLNCLIYSFCFFSLKLRQTYFSIRFQVKPPLFPSPSSPSSPPMRWAPVQDDRSHEDVV